jgi:2-polyprenyl-6-methoxyphenol hydroxylase-like FAD-dependent oxidoreductase
MSGRPDVLVAGAGPTGLTLALQASEHGARVRIVERRTDAFRPSRAMIVHPRTLEVLRPLGVTDELLARGDTAPRVQLHLGARTVPVGLAQLALTDTAFPHLTMLRQADAEAVLAGALDARGVAVEYGTELLDVRETPDGLRALLRTRSGEEAVACRSVVGCDGVDSTVRTRLGIGWPGGTYRREVVLADLDLAPRGAAALERGTAQVVAARGGLLFLFALGERAAWRLLATRPLCPDLQPAGRSGPAVPPSELQLLIDQAGLAARITHVAWSTRVRLQHRIADRYRCGRVFLAGDAAHASSPAGGTGMNVGIQDAANLGWKLAFAARSCDPDALLASYERERRPAAQQVLALTHLIFWAESSTDGAASFLRGTLAPLLAPALPWVLRRRRLVAEGVRLLSQLQAGYRGGPLSEDGDPPRPGRLRAGDRLPDATVTCDGREARLHGVLARPGVHVLLDQGAPPLSPAVTGRYLHVHRLTSSRGAGLVAVRPDGHVGFTTGRADGAALRRWLERAGVVDRSAEGP